MHLPWREMAYANGPAIMTSVLPEELEALAEMARGRRVLEFGTAYGYTAIGMALFGAESVNTVDPHWALQSFPQLVANIGAYEVGHLIAAETGYSIAHEGSDYGLVFIDGDHSYGAVCADLEFAQRVLTPGGTIACHDYGEDCCCPGVRQAIDDTFGSKGGVVAGTLWAVTL